jgi:hypothetical protein
MEGKRANQDPETLIREACRHGIENLRAEASHRKPENLENGASQAAVENQR